ncbi:MAG TPA: hypothetical protein VGW32_02590 [Pyrinomonadaceae bacterium]|nr:hypothetical protein [Pyrinomonadaceae bacterium]
MESFRPDLISPALTYLQRPAVANIFEIAGRFILFELNGVELRGFAEALSEYYCTPVRPGVSQAPDATIRFQTENSPFDVTGFERFEISGGGVGYTEGRTCVFDFEHACVLVHPGKTHQIDLLMRRDLDFQRFDDLQVLNYAISTALRRCDVYELHSGAVVEPQTKRGVLFVGASGSGKSTLTLQLVANGWGFLTDDVLCLKESRGNVQASPLRRVFAVTRSTVEASGSRAREAFANADWSDGSKKAFMPHEVFPEAFSPHGKPHSIFFPTITDEDQSVVKALTPGDTMIHLIKLCPWSCYDPVTSTRHLNVLSSLAKQCNGFKLLAGTDLLRDPARASELVLEHANSATQTF